MVDPAAAISTLSPTPNSRKIAYNGDGGDPIPIDMLTDGDSAALTYGSP